ncbi:MAG: lipid A deacylase LpxR family protein [Gammaproteobacteria bacterium]|nr:lipid A deacylase LpxR family protein [Gammaproteobacteria bacterium]
MKSNTSFTLITLVLCATLCSVAPPIRAEHVVNILVENDVFTGTDRHYTSGLMINYVSGIDDGPRQLQKWGIYFPGIDENDKMHVSISLGHEIYTPTNIDSPQLLVEDRPYAGHAYIAAGFSTANPEEIETWRVSLGLVGAGAGAEYIQNTLHKAIGVDQAQGWRNQLKNEWVISIAYEKKWLNRAWASSPGRAIELDFIPHFTGSTGNLGTHLGIGGMLRVGQGLRKDHGPPKVRPSMPMSQFYDGGIGSSWYFFVGVDTRWVMHNIFLDGNNFRESHSVDRKDFVADLQAGFVWNNESFRIGYTYVVRSKEFVQQNQRDIFGSLSFSLHF